MPDFLLELGLEEVPARMLAAAEAELLQRVLALLDRERLSTPATDARSFSTPRRLAVLVRNVAAQQPDFEEQLLGPAVTIAYKDGAPTPAAHAFARKAGVAMEALGQIENAKGRYLAAKLLREGRAAGDVVVEQLPKEIGAITWPKNMYWRPGKPERFVRPVKWIVALFDATVVPFEFAGVTAGRVTYGHRVLHGPQPLELAGAQAYESTLQTAHVIADVNARRKSICAALDRVTRTVPGARWREDEELVETVTHLTEWPGVLLGSFAQEFLALPEEILVTVMRDHQKYFAVEDATGRLAPYFLAVLNTQATEAGEAIIRHGNERVLRARFSDARFFWDFDQRTPLAERTAMLEKVTFQKDLGNYAEKTERTRGIAHALLAQAGAGVDPAVVDAAVTLAKTDLTTELVKEFTELQGIVGGLYIRAQAEAGDPRTDAIAQAVYWQYMPAAVTDAIPPTAEGQVLGLADRIGTVVDMFGIGLAPTGSKDPYALRRAANAIIRILAAGTLPLTLADVVEASGASSENADAVRAFLLERTEFYLRDVAGLPADIVHAVVGAGVENIADALARGEALASVRGSDDFAAIAAAWKRTKNILRQAGVADPASATVLAEQLQDAAEQDLWANLSAVLPRVESLRAKGAYGPALEQIATLRPHVDAFFDRVMVMVDDEALRANRLALLRTILRELGRIADFSEIVPAVEERG